MTKDEIKNFNYRAFLKLVVETPELLKKVHQLGYKPEDDIFIDLQTPYVNWNGQFKLALLKVYRENVEVDKKLIQEFEELSKKHSMIEGRDYKKELREIEADMSLEIKNELKRLNRTFTRDDDEPLEFMTYDSTSDIKALYPDGTAKFYGVAEPISIGSLLDDGDIQPYDAASLIEQLKLLK
jgi:hypothetical protein